MRRPPRTRRVLKWAGLVVCMLTISVWGVSLWRSLFYDAGVWGVGVNAGGLDVVWGDNLTPFGNPSGWMIPRDFGRVLPQMRGIAWPSGPNLQWARCPLWLLVAGTATLTGILWYRDRRPPRGHCQRCGYNLTGNVTGICPECGEPI